jgi:hypothetical protein
MSTRGLRALVILPQSETDSPKGIFLGIIACPASRGNGRFFLAVSATRHFLTYACSSIIARGRMPARGTIVMTIATAMRDKVNPKVIHDQMLSGRSK